MARQSSDLIATAGRPKSENMPDLTQDQAVASFNEHELKVFNELQHKLEQKLERDLVWYWTTGHYVAGIYRKARTDKQKYDPHFIERLALGLGYKSTATLAGLAKLAEVWPTRDKFEAFTQLRGPTNNRLTLGHMAQLAQIPEESRRKQFAEETLSQRLSVADLQQRIAAADITAKKRRPRGGKRPANLSAYLLHVRGVCEKFNALCTQTWTPPGFDVVAAVRELPIEKITQKLQEIFANAFAAAEAITANHAKLMNAMSQAHIVITERLQEQAILDEVAAEERAEEEDATLDARYTDEETDESEVDAVGSSDEDEYYEITEDDAEDLDIALDV